MVPYDARFFFPIRLPMSYIIGISSHRVAIYDLVYDPKRTRLTSADIGRPDRQFLCVGFARLLLVLLASCTFHIAPNEYQNMRCPAVVFITYIFLVASVVEF